MLTNLEIFVPYSQDSFSKIEDIFHTTKILRCKSINLYPDFIDGYNATDILLKINLNFELPISKNSLVGKQVLLEKYVQMYPFLNQINIGLMPNSPTDPYVLLSTITELQKVTDKKFRLFVDTGYFADNLNLIEFINTIESMFEEVIFYGLTNSINANLLVDFIKEIKNEVSVPLGGLFKITSVAELILLDSYKFSTILLKPSNILGINK